MLSTLLWMSLSVHAEEAIFSNQPIDANNPPISMRSFQAPDPIYCLLRADKPWKEQLGRNTNYLIAYFLINGEEKACRTIALRRADLLARRDFLLEIAPKPAQMTAYKDRDIVYGTKDGMRFGPELFTHYLGQLPSGRHTVRIEVKAYGDIYSHGEFEIEGTDFAGYQALHQQIARGAASGQTMPPAGMVNSALENQMRAALKAAGWPQVSRIVIVDKDWWMNRASGGNSVIVSRHVAAAVATKKADGSAFYKVVTFEQPRLITGGWGTLRVVRTGEAVSLPPANIGK